MPVGLPLIYDPAGFGPDLDTMGGPGDLASWRLVLRVRRVLHGRGFVIGVARSQSPQWAGSDGFSERVAFPWVWQRVLDAEYGQHWWWQPGTGRSFWEDDPAWHKFRDPETDQRWWFHEESGTWFWVVGYSGLPPSHVPVPGGPWGL